MPKKPKKYKLKCIILCPFSCFLYPPKFSSNRLNNKVGVCGAMVKTDSSREGYESDNNVTQPLRVYLRVHESYSNMSPFFKEGGKELNEHGMALFKASVSIINSNLLDLKLFKDLPEQNQTPTRLQFQANKEERYYSVLVCHKFSAKMKPKAGDLRFLFALQFQDQIPSYCKGGLNLIASSTYETHKSMCAFDISHLSDGPIMDLKLSACRSFCDDLQLDEELAKTALIYTATLQEGGVE